MMQDILLDTGFDLKTTGGDFVSGESTRQHQTLLILIGKGELREFPTRGVGAQGWINDDIQAGDFNAAVKREFEADGMKVLRISGTSVGQLIVEAYYG